MEKDKNKMGMSSSQARLLTLTARMHDIEYRAQRLEAQKLQMANESRRAYEDYLNELDRTKLEAKVLGQDGSMTAIPFTANAVYTYKQLTSQYALKTADGKALIPQEYHNAYSTTNNLSDYLRTFGVVSDSITYNRYSEEINPAWQAEYDAWRALHDVWEAKHNDWANRVGDYTEDHFQKKELSTDDFVTATAECTANALNGNSSCYQHVFAHIISFCENNPDSLYKEGQNYYNGGANYVYNINPDKFNGSTSRVTYQSSTGDEFNISWNDLKGSNVYSGYNPESTKYNSNNIGALVEISNKLHEKDATGDYKYKVPVSDDDETYAEFMDRIQNGSLSEDEIKQEKLLSIWNEDGSTKSMLQWAKDLFYLVKTSGSSPSQDVLNTVRTFIQKLDSYTIFDEEAWRNAEPTDEPRFEPTAEKHEIEQAEETTFTDKNYAQWLINIWYKMEGLDEVPQIQEKTFTDVVTGESFTISTVDNKTKTNPQAEGTNKYTNDYENENYIMIPQDKLNDPEWVKNTILEGWVLIQKFDKEGSKFNDTSVAVDTHLQEVADERSLKKAEAKYEADMRRIDQKDRRYDTQLAALDTERNAIKLEMETVKTVARDNVDRTFKLFS